MDSYIDVCEQSISKCGEELCGDKVMILRLEDRTIIVLSDGLGSGVKANILATLTTSIIMTMLRSEANLAQVIETVIGTLPVDREHQIAYATFSILEIAHQTRTFKVINFDNPPVMFFKRGRLQNLDFTSETILNQSITSVSGVLERGDFLCLASDGVVFAGKSAAHNFGWGRKQIASFIEDYCRFQPSSMRGLVRAVMAKTNILYSNKAGDDATFVGASLRPLMSLMVFTGPPLDQSQDSLEIEKLLSFEGRKVICGGTTANIAAEYLHDKVETDITTLRDNVPPSGKLGGIDLVTEGIITMTNSLEVLRTAKCEEAHLPGDRNAAVTLARELVRADAIHFLVGQTINEFYQNPLLPKNLSIRNNLVKELSELLIRFGKRVTIEYC